MYSEYYERTEYNKDLDFTLGDFDGNGKTDILVTAATNKFYRGRITGNTNILLSRIADGQNNTTAIYYNKLSGEYINYTKGTANDNFPVFTYQGPLTVVTGWNINGGYAISIDYAYTGLKIHRQGKGVIGYEKVTGTENLLGIVTETQSGYNTTYYYPQVTSVTKKTTGGTLLETTANTWTQKVLDASTKRILPYISTSVQTNNLTGQKVITSMMTSPDDYGNPGTVAKIYIQGTTTEAVETVTNVYNNNTTSWLLGRPTKTTTVYTRGAESITRVVDREFSATSNRDTAEVWYPGTGKQIRYSHVYYPNGNLKKEMATAGGISRSTSYTYTGDHVRVNTIKDPLGRTTTRNYDSYGRLQNEADYLDNTTAYTYDNMGRVATVTGPDGLVTTTAYNWGLTGGPTNACYYAQQSGNDGSLSKTWYDKLGREIRSDIKGFSGSDIYMVTEYNTKGQVYRVSDPSVTATPSLWTKYTYLADGRLQKVERPTGSMTTYAYDGKKTTETTDGRSAYKETDSQGALTKAHDTGGDILYTYWPDGKVKTITAPDGIVTSMEYDIAGNQTKLTDPSAGTIRYSYTGFGQMDTLMSARGEITTFNYQPNGLLNTKISPEGQTAYTYDAATKQLTGITSPDSVSKSFAYETTTVKGRLKTISETIPGSSAILTTFDYDGIGRLYKRTHPSGIVEEHEYQNGYLKKVKAGGNVVYEITDMNERGQITSSKYGASLTSTHAYTTLGFPDGVTTGNIQNLDYTFDAVKGWLTDRENRKHTGCIENFLYDAQLLRLDSIYGNPHSQGGLHYAANGNILRKSDIGTMVYGHPTKPYAITELSTTTNLVPLDSQIVHYTSFEQVKDIADNGYFAQFVYNSDQQRAIMEMKYNGSTQYTRWYAGSRYMKETKGASTKQYTWIGGDAYSAPVVAVTESGSTAYYYLLRDYLGSVTHQINSSNLLVAEYSFDAWGRRRSADDWNYTLDANDKELFAGRGFTGHEHLPEFNLINMNGRLYDPLLGRFLSPDNNVQMPDITQNFNRYSYALNNPLSFTDPDGEFIWGPIIALTIQQAIAGGARANLQGKSIIEGALKGATVSIVISAATAGMGLLAPSLNSTAVTMGDNAALLGKYALKAGYATLTGAVASGFGMLSSDFLDDGKINISGHDYFKSMKIAGVTAATISIANSADKYATWDRFNFDQKIEILKNDLKIDNLHLGFDKGYGYRINGEIYLTPLGIENRSISEHAISHEQFHIIDDNRYFDARYIPNDREIIGRNFEARAHLEGLKHASDYNITSRCWQSSRYYARDFGYLGKIPNTLQFIHIWNNLFY